MKKREQLRRAREAAKLTQAALAQQVGTSQQQIQRVEAGHSIRLDLATRIAAILQRELVMLFPEIRPAIKKAKTKQIAEKDLHRELAQVGLDPDPVTWTLKLQMRSGLERYYVISSMEAERIQRCLGHPEARSMSFDAVHAEVYVRLEHVRYAHLLWDGPAMHADAEAEAEAGPAVTVWFGDREPLVFEVEGGEDDNDPDEEDEEAVEPGQIRNLLVGLDLEYEEPFVSFNDADGERVFLRTAEIQILEASHSVFLMYSDEDADPTNHPPPDERAGQAP